MTKGKTGLIPYFLLILILFAGCATDKAANIQTKTNLPIETDAKTEDISTEMEPSEEEIIENEIDSLISAMTIEEKIGQLFIISVRNSYNGTRMLHADEYMKNVIETYKPGGIIFFTINFANPIQTRDLIRNTQLMSPIPLFMAVDEEGGKVARLGNTDRMFVTKLPPASVIGRSGKSEYARMASTVITRELKAFGFNMNMAPVADVNTNSANPVIGDRTYSENPYEAGKLVAAVVETMKEENMTSVLKHYPGHGDTNSDTHDGSVIVLHDRKRLNEIEFIPFIMGIEAGADAVMTAHIKVPEVTGNDLPATMSPYLLKNILRDELGFEGIIITDAMDMGAVTNYWSSGEATVNALKAGVDIILMPARIGDSFEAVKKALDEGVLTEQRIDESVRRILKVKIRRDLFSGKVSGSDELLDIIGSEEHNRIIETILP